MNYRNFDETIADCLAKNKIYDNFYAITLSFSHLFKNSATNNRGIASLIKKAVPGSSVYLFEVSGTHLKINSHNKDNEAGAHIHGVIFSKSPLDKKVLEYNLGNALLQQKNGIRKVCVSNRNDDLEFWIGYIQDHSNKHDASSIKDTYHCFKESAYCEERDLQDSEDKEQEISLYRESSITNEIEYFISNTSNQFSSSFHNTYIINNLSNNIQSVGISDIKSGNDISNTQKNTKNELSRFESIRKNSLILAKKIRRVISNIFQTLCSFGSP
ncbi:MAG: hypothetical protein PHE67_08000 [Campylobacterales bacterium]|nr:hypothetical protein [Campylobacterales bacterium]